MEVYGPYLFLFNQNLSYSLMDICCMKMCHNWCKWDKCPPIHSSFLCLWDGALTTPCGPCTLVSEPSKGGPTSFDPLHGCGKTFLHYTVKLIFLPCFKIPWSQGYTPSILWLPYLLIRFPTEQRYLLSFYAAAWLPPQPRILFRIQTTITWEQPCGRNP